MTWLPETNPDVHVYSINHIIPSVDWRRINSQHGDEHNHESSSQTLDKSSSTLYDMSSRVTQECTDHRTFAPVVAMLQACAPRFLTTTTTTTACRIPPPAVDTPTSAFPSHPPTRYKIPLRFVPAIASPRARNPDLSTPWFERERVEATASG